jgi:predicted NBD/HSP70 family sugar kinase
MMLLALELSRSQCAALLADDTGKPIQHLRSPFAPNMNAATQWLQTMKLARDVCFNAALAPENLSGITLAFDGIFNESGFVEKTPISGGFEGYNLTRGLQEHLHNSNTSLTTETNAQGIGEHRFGALQNETDWVFIDLDYQMNSVAAKNGVLFSNDVGAQTIERDGPLDDFGKRGTFRAFCASIAFEARCRSYSLSGGTQIFELRDSNFAAQSLAEDFISRLAQGISGGIALLNPRIICLGGNFATSLWPYIEKELALKMRDYMAPDVLSEVDFRLSTLGPDGAALGALTLALQNQNAG